MNARPIGQGIVALSALAILRHTDPAALPPLSARRLHRQIEALRLAFADARRYVCDPANAELDWQTLFSKEYAQARAALINPERRNAHIRHGTPIASSDTVQFCVADRDANAVSMVNSVYTTFGSGIVPGGLGFVLQNRGCSFTLAPAHPNCVGPNKRP
jgi:gamma-glutamyltranspeptidase/glutathione hydrolase